jgi:hypothetical protein
MKIYKAYVDYAGELHIDCAEATVTAKQVMLEGDMSLAAWKHRRRFNKHLPLHKSERAALKAFMEELVSTNRFLQGQIRKNQGHIEAARAMMEEL